MRKFLTWQISHVFKNNYADGYIQFPWMNTWIIYFRFPLFYRNKSV